MAPKTKQPTKGSKQILEENEVTLKFYRNVILAVNVLYFSVMLLFFRGDFTWWIICLLAICGAIYASCFYFMRYMARPTLDLSGNVLDPGSDLCVPDGLAEHVKDVLLYSAIVQTLSLVSNYCWLFSLVIPARAFYLLWVNFLGPWFFAPAPEVDEKKQKKMERKMKRR